MLLPFVGIFNGSVETFSANSANDDAAQGNFLNKVWNMITPIEKTSHFAEYLVPVRIYGQQ